MKPGPKKLWMPTALTGLGNRFAIPTAPTALLLNTLFQKGLEMNPAFTGY